MKNIIIISMMAFLASCSWLKEKPQEFVKVPIPNELRQDCPEIKKLSNRELGELLKHDTELMFQYEECSTRFKNYKKAVEGSK